MGVKQGILRVFTLLYYSAQRDLLSHENREQAHLVISEPVKFTTKLVPWSGQPERPDRKDQFALPDSLHRWW